MNHGPTSDISEKRQLWQLLKKPRMNKKAIYFSLQRLSASFRGHKQGVRNNP
jgi:hypothetical protein